MYDLKSLFNYKTDFDKIDDVKVKYSQGSIFLIVKGDLHLYGYKINDDTQYSGFYDVINQRWYPKTYLENKDVTFITNTNETIYNSPKKPRVLKKFFF